MEQKTEEKSKAWIWILIALAVIIIGIVVYVLVSGSDGGIFSISGGNSIPTPPAFPE
jgi:flagellar basal body-associated protein FliL